MKKRPRIAHYPFERLSVKHVNTSAVVVAQLVERSLPSAEIRSSNLVIGKI